MNRLKSHLVLYLGVQTLEEPCGPGRTCQITIEGSDSGRTGNIRDLTCRRRSCPSLSRLSRFLSRSTSLSRSLSRSPARRDWCLKLPICDGCDTAERKLGREVASMHV